MGFALVVWLALVGGINAGVIPEHTAEQGE